MTLPRTTADGAKVSHSSPSNPMQSQGFQLEVSSSSPSWGKHVDNITDTPISTSLKKSKVEESDEELFMVPDVEAQPPNTNNSTITTANISDVQNQSEFPGKRRRGRNPVDKEYKRLKRLLRNRVSAQQARERKKVYVNELESRARELQDQNLKLEEKISTLINENAMLRKVLMNSRPKVDNSVDK
ncbi:hypothetical protein SLA2020_457420 [Shorea laevis]